MKENFYFILSQFIKPWKRKNNNKLIVLAYHEVPCKIKFEKQLQFLRSNYNLIDIVYLDSYFKKEENLPINSLIITFDDGDYSVYKNAFPLLKKYHIPAVIFIISELINSENTFWCRWVENVYNKNGRSYAEARKEVNRLKNISNEERMKTLNKLPAVKSKQLSIGEIKEMETYNITMGNHTHTHPMINKCTPVEIIKEMDEVKKNFKEWGLKGYPYFAYPNGNLDSGAEEILISKNINMAFLFDHKVNQVEINPMRISRIRVNADANLNEFKVKVSGLHSGLMRMKNKIFKY